MRKFKFSNIFIYGFLSIYAVLQVLPFYFAIINSVQPHGFTPNIYKFYFLPVRWAFENYPAAWSRVGILTGFMNTMIVEVFFVSISAFIAMLVGYVLAKKRFRGNKVAFMCILATMIVPGEVLLIPMFILCRTMHITNSLIGVIFPGIISVFGIFVAKQFMETIPDSYIESAIIDGASEFRIFTSVIMPMAQAALATYCIMTFVGVWNDYLWPYIILTNNKLYTLQICLAKLTAFPADAQGLVEAQYVAELRDASIISTIAPPLIIFFVFQKKFVEGLTLSGIK